MSQCIHCQSNRLLKVYGKVSDLGDYGVDHLAFAHSGYAPHIVGVCGGDDIDLTVCLDCLRIQVELGALDDDAISEAFHDVGYEGEVY